jgi:hypothetical protein
MFGRKLKTTHWLLISVAVIAGLALSALARWRTDILEDAINPKRPYQVYYPPRAPDYAQRAAWAMLPGDPAHPAAGDPPADVFFIHPTTFNGGRNWNGPIDDAPADHFLEHVILPNYAGPFVRAGRLFAPRYRQASLYTALTLKDDAREAREFAYFDVRRAFDAYLARYNEGRPLVIVGVEQGGLLAQRLLRDELAEHPDLTGRLAAAYLIDSVALRDDYGPAARLPACQRQGEPRCVVGWTQSYGLGKADFRRIFERSLVWDVAGRLVEVGGRPVLCVNPMLGRESDDEAPARLNIGAVNASDLGWDARPAFLSRQVSAQCVAGVLRVTRPSSPALKSSGGWLDRLKEPGFNLFYGDLEADALGRVAALTRGAGP